MTWKQSEFSDFLLYLRCTETPVMTDNDRLVDLDKVVATKFKGKKIPGFVVSFLKKFIHQDFLNSILSDDSDGVEFCEHTLNRMGVTLEVEGLENVPADGTLYTFASNHPLGGIDGLALCSIIGRHFGEVKMPVNDFLMYIKPLEPLFIPVNKTGSLARNLPTMLDSAFRSDDQILIFPAGICSRRIGGTVQDLPWTKTFITKSRATSREIVPVHFIGENSSRFYRVANLCKALKLKFNFAMLFLPDEMYRARGSHFKVVFGKPLPAGTFDSSRTPLQWASYIREKVYQLQ